MNGRPNDERHFIHKKILGIGGGILSAVGNIAPFLPASGILRTLGGAATRLSGGGPRASSRAPLRPVAGQPGGLRPVAQPPRPLEITEPVVIGAGVGRGEGAGIIVDTGSRGIRGAPEENGVCPPRGFHLNKSSYFLRDGTFVEARSRFVRNRRLNNANGRAQDKAIVRLEKGQDHAKKLLKATGWRTISKRSAREMRNANKKVCA